MSHPATKPQKQRQQKQAPRKKKGGLGDDLKKEDLLKAVVLADSFAVRFRPFTHTKPKVLLPLVNVPMLEYTLEFLCSNGVQEVYVFCVSHASQVEAYIVRTPILLSRCSPALVRVPCPRA